MKVKKKTGNWNKKQGRTKSPYSSKNFCQQSQQYKINNILRTHQILTPIMQTSSICSRLPLHPSKANSNSFRCSVKLFPCIETIMSSSFLYLNFLPFGPPN